MSGPMLDWNALIENRVQHWQLALQRTCWFVRDPFEIEWMLHLEVMDGEGEVVSCLSGSERNWYFFYLFFHRRIAGKLDPLWGRNFECQLTWGWFCRKTRIDAVPCKLWRVIQSFSLQAPLCIGFFVCMPVHLRFAQNAYMYHYLLLGLSVIWNRWVDLYYFRIALKSILLKVGGKKSENWGALLAIRAAHFWCVNWHFLREVSKKGWTAATAIYGWLLCFLFCIRELVRLQHFVLHNVQYQNCTLIV